MTALTLCKAGYRLNWSEVKPRTQCRLEPSYIPVRKSQPQQASPDQEAGGTSPKGTSKKSHSR